MEPGLRSGMAAPGAAVAALPLLAAAAVGDTYLVEGTASGVIGHGLELLLQYSDSCLPDGQTFTVHSTNTNDCFTTANIAEYGNKSVNQSTFDGVATVSCRCGSVSIPPFPATPAMVSGGGAQIVGVPKNATQFTFTSPIADISSYLVSIYTAPGNPTESCSVTNPSGIVRAAAASSPMNSSRQHDSRMTRWSLRPG